MLDTQTILIIVCVCAVLAALGVVSPWTPITAPILIMLMLCALSLVVGAVYSISQPRKK